MSQKITAHLWQVAGGELTDPSDAAAYLVRFGAHAALIDAGCGAAHDRLRANIDACLQDDAKLDLLLLTHCHYDHTGGAEAVRNDYGCAIAAHELDAVYLESGDSEVTAASWYGARMNPLAVDIKLKGEKCPLQVGDGQITAIHWPGHSPGSVVYTTNVDGRHILLGQDVHGPIHPALLSDHNQYQRSLAKLVEIKADLLLEGHFGVIEGQAAIQKFIRSFMN
jgi:glyoxylase-like metal-dependent hydrolase (beta-lactamase superfamily II)